MSESAPPAPLEPEEDSIGIARLREDGTIELQLIARAPDGTEGDALILVAPSEDRYASVLAHLGEIPPGGSVAVRPFPPKDDLDDGYDWD